ncbi:MAG: zinc permease [Dehalococcoidia bacterium]|nr:zinc permease [Dehalococcoidia bacterium]
MPLSQLLLLGALAGYTIFLGLPVARMRRVSEVWRIGTAAASAGILLFLLVDVTKHLTEPIEDAAKSVGRDGVGTLALLGAVALLGLAVGFLTLVFLPSVFQRGKASPGPGAMAAAAWESPIRLSVLIAVGIGFHNFAEGLAIGQEAAAGAISLALLLIIGFGLHNATEGFGIIGPLVGRVRPSWMFLLSVGLIGGSPTFLGTIIGQAFTSKILETLFLALAAGSIIYVVQTLVYTGLREGRHGVFSVGLMAGLVVGIGTELVIAAAGV